MRRGIGRTGGSARRTRPKSFPGSKGESLRFRKAGDIWHWRASVAQIRLNPYSSFVRGWSSTPVPPYPFRPLLVFHAETATGGIELGELLCESLEEVSDSTPLSFAMTSTEVSTREEAPGTSVAFRRPIACARPLFFAPLTQLFLRRHRRYFSFLADGHCRAYIVHGN